MALSDQRRAEFVAQHVLGLLRYEQDNPIVLSAGKQEVLGHLTELRVQEILPELVEGGDDAAAVHKQPHEIQEVGAGRIGDLRAVEDLGEVLASLLVVENRR